MALIIHIAIFHVQTLGNSVTCCLKKVFLHNIINEYSCPCAEIPPPLPVRVTPARYVVLDTSADLVLDARFRGNFYFHDWVYNEDDPTFASFILLSLNAARTNVGQTFTIPAGSSALRVGYYGPRLVLTSSPGVNVKPSSENTVIVGSFSKCMHY